MKNLLLLSFLFLAAPDTFDVAPGAWGLPAGARVLEARRVPSQVHADRGLVLWMKNPEDHPRSDDLDDPYTCPDETRGHYLSGPAFVSLVDVKARKVLDTLAIAGGDGDALDLPYKIHAGSYYRVEHPAGKLHEGRPTLLDLRDFNGDGRAQELALYDAEACMGLGTTLIGYSEKRDRVIQYPVRLAGAPQLWTDYLFSEKPVEPGHWKYSIDYTGRGGCVDSYDVRYDAKSESFTGTFQQTRCEEVQ
jgi:hypothetical protein